MQSNRLQSDRSMVQIRVSPQTIFVKLRFDNKRTKMLYLSIKPSCICKGPFVDQHNFLELQLHLFVVERVALDYIEGLIKSNFLAIDNRQGVGLREICFM